MGKAKRFRLRLASYWSVYVDGDVVQDVIADSGGFEAMVIDCDNEGGEPKSRAFAPPRMDPDCIDATVNGAED